MSTTPSPPPSTTASPVDGWATPSLAPSPRSVTPLLVAAAIGGAVALSLGVYGRVHTPTRELIYDFGFSSTLAMKAWFTTVAAALGLLQAASAAWLWGRLPGFGAAPGWLGPAHRWIGTVAFFFTLPVAYHCLWALGFQTTTTRVLAHSLLGCAFYGALTTKLLVLRFDRLPGWSLPVVGGTLFALLTGVWLTSSLWYFTTIGFPAL